MDELASWDGPLCILAGLHAVEVEQEDGRKKQVENGRAFGMNCRGLDAISSGAQPSCPTYLFCSQPAPFEKIGRTGRKYCWH